MTRVIAIRPEPGLAATLDAGRSLGLAMAGWPLFEIRACDWAAPDPAEVDGLLIGSANALRHCGQVLESLTHKPVFAVGETTADFARSAGLEVAMTGQGGLQKVLDTLAGQQMRLLRLTGADHVALVPPAGIELVTRVAYESAALPMPDGLARALAQAPVVLLHSGLAAHHLRSECDKRGIDRARISLAVLAPRIALEAGEGWKRIVSAEKPRETALLALARDMCH